MTLTPLAPRRRTPAPSDPSGAPLDSRAPLPGTRRRVRRAGPWPLTALLALGAAAAAACGEDQLATPSGDPASSGPLVGVNGRAFVDPTGQGLGWPVDPSAPAPDSVERIWVADGDDDPCGVIWTVDETTELQLRESSALRRAVPADFTPLRRTLVWTRGAIAESCPAQGTADVVELR